MKQQLQPQQGYPLLFFAILSLFLAICLAQGTETPSHPGDANFGSTKVSTISALGGPANKRLMAPLKRFLREKNHQKAKKMAVDVYDAAKTATQRGILESEIRKFLKENWYTERQAIYNLLSFPALIPIDSTLKYILKGLTEPKDKAYVLAATSTVTDVVWKDKVDAHIKSLLAKIVEENHGAITFHALNALDKFLDWPDDAHLLLPVTDHRDPDTQGQLVSMLVRHLRPHFQLEPFTKYIHDNGAPADAATKLIDQYVVQTEQQRKGQVIVQPDIPIGMGLNEFLRTVKYRNCLLQFYKRFDENADGKIDVKEAAKFLGHFNKKVTEIAQMFVKADTDKDGFIDETDWYYMLKEFVHLKDEELDRMNEDGTTPPPVQGPENAPKSE